MTPSGDPEPDRLDTVAGSTETVAKISVGPNAASTPMYIQAMLLSLAVLSITVGHAGSVVASLVPANTSVVNATH
jgi:hypothetical protein